MKRFVIATASALFLVAGTAAASVPSGPAARSAHLNPYSAAANGGPGVETGAPTGLAPLAPGIKPALLADPDLAIPGLPGGVTQLFGAVDPALNTLAGVVPPAVDALLPSPVEAEPTPVPPPAPVPGVTPGQTPPQDSKKAPAPAGRNAAANRVTQKATLRTAAAGDALDALKALPPDGYGAYGTASVVHAHALQVSGQRLENTDAAFSGATFSSAPIPQSKNEMARVISPALVAGNAYARGSGLEAGLGIGESDPNQIVPGSIAEAKAPPSTGLVSKEVNVAAPPVVTASLLRGQAQAKANSACTTGTDLSKGLGYAADLGLLSDAVKTAGTTPDRTVSQSLSHTFLVPQDGAQSPIRTFGLASETRETIAPVTLFKGTPAEFTLELAGEWVLKAVADGKSGKVTYGPGSVSPDTPLLRIIRPGSPSPTVTEILSTQALFGPGGFEIPGLPLVHVTIGTPPRAIGGETTSKPTETATLAAAAVDVVRVTLLDTGDQTLTAADIRIGHMEVATAVPAGGITCGIQLTKNTDKDLVGGGDSFNWTIKVTNPNDCVLTKLKVVDTITATPGIIWTVDSSTPAADQKSNSGLTWNDVGPLNPGQSKDLTIGVTVDKKTGAGKFLDEVLATGVCGPAAGTAGAEAAVGVPLEARVSLNLPEVSAVLGGTLLPRELPRTGGLLMVFPALALTGGGMFLMQANRRRRRKP